MRLLWTVVIFLISISTIKAKQYVGSVSLNSQEMIAEFFALNSDVDSIIGNVSIINGLDITSLQPMKNIKYIEGVFLVRHCKQLSTIEGLNENLTVTIRVELKELIVLKNIEPLRSVNTPRLSVTGCRLLGDDQSNIINANVTRISLDYYKGSNLDFLYYYPSLKQLSVSNCKELDDIDGISSLKELKYLYFSRNRWISDCTIDSLCSKMEDGLQVFFEDNDDSCNSMVDEATGCTVSYYPCGESTLTIQSKDMLDFFISEGVDCVEDFNKIAIRFQDDEGPLSFEGLPIFPNLSSISIQDTRHLKTLSGLISSSKINQIVLRNNEALEDLGSQLLFDEESIDVIIEDNPKLRNIDGLSGYRSVSNFTLTSNHPELAVSEDLFINLSVDDVLKIGTISSDMSQVLSNVKSCNSLTLDSILLDWEDITHIELNELNINGIEGLSSIDFIDFPNALYSLTISNCKDLVTVENIKLQNSSGGISFINSGIQYFDFDEGYPMDYVREMIFDEVDMEEITFPKINKIWRSKVNGCPDLKSLDFHSNVKDIDYFTIYNNSSLESLGEIIPNHIGIYSLTILGNEVLTDISALGHNVELEQYLNIIDNPKLESCGIDAICRSIRRSPGSVRIRGNSDDCEKFNLMLGVCDSIDIKPFLNDVNLFIFNQSTLDYISENHSKIDSIEGLLYIKVDYADEDRVRDLSFFDSLKFIGNKLKIIGDNFDLVDSTEALDLSNFDHCGFVELEINNVLIDRLPIIDGNSPIEKITLDLKSFDGNFSPFNEIDTLDFLDVGLNNTEAELNGFESLLHVTDFRFSNIDNLIGDFCDNLSSIDELKTTDCVPKSISIFDNVRINERLIMSEVRGIKDEDLKFELQQDCSLNINDADSLNLSFLENTPALSQFIFQKSTSMQLNFDFLHSMDLDLFLLRNISNIDSITLPEFNVEILIIDNCSKLKDINLPTVKDIPVLEIKNCQNFEAMNVPLLESINIFKLINNSSVVSIDFIPDETEIKLIKLSDNIQFNGCEDPLFCNNLELGNSIILSGDNGNCNIYSLNAACGIDISKCPTEGFHITTTQNYATFMDEYSACSTIQYDFTIDKSVVLDSSFLDDVNVVLGDLTIQEGTGISNNLDLSNLRYIDGSLTISGGDFNSTIFDDVELSDQFSMLNVTNELIDARNIFSLSSLSAVDCSNLVEINMNRNDFINFKIENCPQLEKINPLPTIISSTLSLNNLEKFGEIKAILNSFRNPPNEFYLNNLPLLDTFNFPGRSCDLLSLTNNENLSLITGCCFGYSSYINISNCNKIEQVDINELINHPPREVLLYSNENLKSIVLHGVDSPYKSNNIEITDNPNLVDLSFSDGWLSTENLIIDNNDRLKSFIVSDSVKFKTDYLQLTNNFDLETINVYSSAVVGEFIAENNTYLKDISGFGDSEMFSFDLVNNDKLSDISKINPNLNCGNLDISNNSELAVCNHDFVCNHISSGKPMKLSNNGDDCQNIQEVNSLCMSNLTEITNRSLNVYPNPASDRLTISSEKRMETVYIYDALGQEVLRMPTQSNSLTIKLSSFDSGLYYLKTDSNEVVKFVVE